MTPHSPLSCLHNKTMTPHSPLSCVHDQDHDSQLTPLMPSRPRPTYSVPADHCHPPGYSPLSYPGFRSSAFLRLAPALFPRRVSRQPSCAGVLTLATDAKQHCDLRCTLAQCNAVQCRTVQCCALLYSVVKEQQGVVQCRGVLLGTVQCCGAQWVRTPVGTPEPLASSLPTCALRLVWVSHWTAAKEGRQEQPGKC